MIKSITNKAHLFGPFLFLIILFLPTDLTKDQQNFLAIFSLVVWNWLFSSLPLYISGLLGVSLSTVFGVVSATEAFQHFANPIIFLFLGGFLFAKAMNEHELDRRISLYLLSRPFIRGSFRRMLFSLYTLTAFFSMWVSNTATTAMMLPIILGILGSLNIKEKSLNSLLLLGLAYSASIGGLGTPIGSPPNLIAMGLLKNLAQIDVSFLDWSLVGMPLVILFLVVLFYIISQKIPKEMVTFNNSHIKNQFLKLKKISQFEINLMILFTLLVFFWFAPSLVSSLWEENKALTSFLNNRLHSGTISVFFASLLFLFPLNTSQKILSGSSIKEIDWPSLLLFGSGLSLGKILFATGLAQIAGDFIVNNLVGGSFMLLLVIIIYMTIFATELASNTASANILLPIIVAIGLQLDISVKMFAFAIAMACSLAFMLPVATPPNAIVYGTEKVEVKDMIRFGLKLNLLYGLLMSIIFYFLAMYF